MIPLALLGHPHHFACRTRISRSEESGYSHRPYRAPPEPWFIAKYDIKGNAQDDPGEFWGLTEFDVDTFHEFNMLRYVPILRVVQDHHYLTEQVRRHRNVDRPDLLEVVTAAFESDDHPKFGPDILPEHAAVRRIADRAGPRPRNRRRYGSPCRRTLQRHRGRQLQREQVEFLPPLMMHDRRLGQCFRDVAVPHGGQCLGHDR